MKIRVLFELVVLTFIISACSSQGDSAEHNDVKIYVKTCKVGVQKDESTNTYLGVVEEKMSAVISFPLSGNIDKIVVAEGQIVKQGQLLATLNDYSIKNTHTMALATLKQAEDAMKRIQMLYDNKSLPEVQYIEMQTNLEKARAAEAIAKKNLKDSEMTAPFNGIVGQLRSEVGENVLPNQTVLTLLRINEVNIKVAVPENEINDIKIGETANVRIAAVSDELFSGEITSKGVVADPISHTYEVKILVTNPNNLLLPGMVSRALIKNSCKDDAIIVPNQCILKDGNNDIYVWKVSEGIAKKQVIEIGLQKNKGVEVLKGLNSGDEIIVDGYQKVSAGLKVIEL
ncbi:efflux RND transporter periplasmic adaptor subunit [Puteibacter caeruleilacunae]|nr:efflux RND transporter periplasmic adaptor subunit [Puteibacter caeruleilacunae]